MGRNNLSGAWGEALAADFMRKKRYEILCSGFRCRFGEIDLIVCDRNTLVFVEVKLRKTDDFAQAHEFVDYYKQNRIRTTASYYLSNHPTQRNIRFDVIEIYAPDGVDTHKPKIQHMEGAFQ